MSEPARHLSLDDLPALLASVPALRREVAELRAEVETLKGRGLRCECGSTSFSTTKTSRAGDSIRRLRRCRACKRQVTTREVLTG